MTRLKTITPLRASHWLGLLQRCTGPGLLTLLLLTPAYAEIPMSSTEDLVLGRQSAGAITTARDVILNGSRVYGPVLAGREAKGNNCLIQGKLLAGASVHLHHCENKGPITAGRNLILYQSTIEDSSTAGHALMLVHSTIKGDVTAGGKVFLDGSHVEGTLYTTAPNVTLKGSTVQNIQVKASDDFHHTGSIIIQGKVANSTANVHINTGFRPTRVVRVGAGSTSVINGYSIKATPTETTLMTPDNTLYVNGVKTHGNGPEQYAGYRAKNPEAPDVEGPGWQSTAHANTAAGTTENQHPAQVIQLTENSRVFGTIEFESGNGKVIVHPGSQFSGTVKGGSIDQISSR